MLGTERHTKQRMRRLIPILVALTGFALKMTVFRWYPCPPGADPGLRIKNAVNLATVGEPDIPYPAFDVTLSILWIVCGMTKNNVILVCEVFVALITSALAFPAYSISDRVFGERGAPEVCSFLFVFYPALHELVSFGSYTQALALFLISQTIALAVKDGNKQGLPKNIVASTVSAALLMMHFWSYAILAVTGLVFLILSTLLVRKYRTTLITSPQPTTLIWGLLGAFLVSAPWWSSNLSFLSSTLLFVPTGLTGMRGTTVRIERFFSPYWLYLTLIPAAIVRTGHFGIKKKEREKSVLLSAWLITPILLTQSHLLGIAADYRRLWYYPALPAMIISSFGLSFVVSLIHLNFRTVEGNDLEHLRSRSKKYRSAGNLLALPIVIAILASPGWWTIHDFRSAAYFYIHIRNSQYEMIGWIGEAIPEGREIVSGGTVGWWIPGLSRRHVIPAIPTAFIGVSWQAERAEAASFLIGSNQYEITNGPLRIRDSNPYLSARNPLFEIWKDTEFEQILLLNDHDVELVGLEGKVFPISELAERTCSWETLSEREATLNTNYKGNGLSVVKSISLMRGGQVAKMEFRLTSLKKHPINQFRMRLSVPEQYRYEGIVESIEEYGLGGEDRRESAKWVRLQDSRRGVACLLVVQGEAEIQTFEDEEGITRLDLEIQPQENRVVLYVGGYGSDSDGSLSEDMSDNAIEELFSPEEGEGSKITFKDYWQIVDTYDIRYLVTIRGDNTRNFMDPNMDLLFTTGRDRVFGLSAAQEPESPNSG